MFIFLNRCVYFMNDCSIVIFYVKEKGYFPYPFSFNLQNPT